MSDISQIAVTALQAFQAAINTTSNNIANASTPGYDKESVTLEEAIPQANGTIVTGSGVQIGGVTRSYSAAQAQQANSSQSSLSGLDAQQSYASQIDNLFGTTVGGLSTAVQNYYSAWSTVASDPSSSASRQALLSAAQGVSSSFQSASGDLSGLNGDINQEVSADVQQINSLGSSIASLNTQIAQATAANGGQPPNELMDQRDQAVASLSKLVGVNTTTDSTGQVSVFIGSGTSLVVSGQSTPLTTVANPYNATQLEVASASNPSQSISASISSGDLGGVLAARTQVVDPAQNALGQLATALATSANTQQAQGVDLTGKQGQPIFSLAAPTATASATNTDNVTASVSIDPTALGSLSSQSYILSSKGGALSLTDATTGAVVNYTGTGTAADPIVVNGAQIVLSGTPANGDSFLVEPVGTAASSIAVTMSNPSGIAAAGALTSSAGTANTGTATIGTPTVTDSTNANLLTPATITFTSPTTYTINNGAAQTYTAGGNIDDNGWQVQITGTPATGDTFSVAANSGASGDNTNALAAANAQNSGVLDNGTESVTEGVSSMITDLGSQVQQINTAQSAADSINTQNQNTLQSTTGVNLDEEAADLLQWQQAYQAAAQTLQIGSTLFTSLLQAVQNA